MSSKSFIKRLQMLMRGVKKNPDDSLISEAKKYFGTTYNPNEAGYLLPDGTMLDFTGRHYASGYLNKKPLPGQPDYLKNQRSVDHRELGELVEGSGTKGMLEFMKDTDAVRMAVIRGDTNIAFFKNQKLTPAQVKALSKINSMYGGTIIYDMWDTKGDTVKSGEAKSTKVLKSALLENPHDVIGDPPNPIMEMHLQRLWTEVRGASDIGDFRTFMKDAAHL